MTCATHAQLSESSVSEHMHTHDGKGREGKGRGRESRGETSHHDVAYVTRAAAAPAPVEPRDDMMTGLSVVEGIDLDAEVPCRADNDEHAADMIIRTVCPGCANTHVYGVCRDVWSWMDSRRFECGKCSTPNLSRDDFARIVEVLR